VHREHRRLAGALIELDGTLGFHGWQWLFVVEGIPAILLAFVVWTRLPDRPSTAPWLAPETGRALERTLAAEQDAGAGAHGGHAFGTALRDPQIWLAIFVYFCHQLTIYTVIFFLPGIIGASGRFSPFAVGLLTALPWLAAACGAATLPRFARESRHSRRMLCAGLVVMAAGMVGAAHASPAAGLLCVCVAAFMFFVVQSIVFTFPASRLAGNALAGGLGLVNTCGLLGGFVGPTVVGAIEQATGNAKNGLTLLAAALVIAAFASLALRHGHERPGARSPG
jgi:cyanate permease